jgi:hypothetical protein
MKRCISFYICAVEIEARKRSILWDIMKCSQLKVNRRFGGTYRLQLQVEEEAEQEISVKTGGEQNLCLPPVFTMVSCSAFSSIFKTEASCSSETSVHTERTTWRYISHGRTLLNHPCE